VIAFIIRRFLAMLVVMFGVASITFIMMRLSPGSPFADERNIPEHVEQRLLEKYELQGSVARQYFSYLGSLLTGDLRVSLKYKNRSVGEILAQALPVSAILGGCAFILSTTLGVGLGALAALRQNSWIDTGAMLLALVAISIPSFVTGPILVYIVALQWGWLPIGGWGTLRHLILPTIVLAAPFVAYIARLMRTSMLETLNQEYIRTARAKGVSETGVLIRHALKIAILPVVSFLGPLAANLLTGSIVVETIFHIPGAGRYFVYGILNADVFLLNGVVIIYCFLVLLMNFFVDITYTVLDRRIKLYG